MRCRGPAQRFRHLVAIGAKQFAAVPATLAFRPANAFGDRRTAGDQRRAIIASCRRKGIAYGLDIVSVYLSDMPAGKQRRERLGGILNYYHQEAA